MKYTLVFLILLCVVLIHEYGECKRMSSGRSRGSSSGGSTLWGSLNKKKGSSSGRSHSNSEAVALSYPKQTAVVDKPKPSAPKLETQRVHKPVSIAPQGTQKVGTANTHKQVTSSDAGGAMAGSGNNGQQRPIGWNVDNKANQGQLQTKTVANNQQQSIGYVQPAPPSYTPNNYGQGVRPAYNAGGYGQIAPPAYSAAGHGQGVPPAYNQGSYGHGPPPYNTGSYPQGAPPAYSAGSYSQPNYHPQGQIGMPYSPSYAGNAYGNNGGMFGSSFGGKHNSGYGGFGMGSFGGMGGYGGMMGQKRSFGSGFASHAFTSVATGLLVWSLMRGGRSHYYNVYNHNNHPEAVPQEIALPANVITLCPENVTALCAQNTVPLCTSEGTILCAVTASATVSCADGSGSCVETADTSPHCTDCGDVDRNETIAIPCISNATINGQVNISGDSLNNGNTMTLFKDTAQNTETVLCVTTMAMPNPEEEKALIAMHTSATDIPPQATDIDGTNNTTSVLSFR